MTPPLEGGVPRIRIVIRTLLLLAGVVAAAAVVFAGAVAAAVWLLGRHGPP